MDWIVWLSSGEDSGEKMCVGGFFWCVFYILHWSVAVSCHFGLINNKLNRTETVGILKMYYPVMPSCFLELNFWGCMSRSS